MLTVDGLTSGPAALLRCANPVGGAPAALDGRGIRTVQVCGADWRLPRDGRRRPEVLVLLPAPVPAAEAAAALRELAAGNVVAAVLVPEADAGLPARLRQEAYRVGLPLLVPDEPLSVAELETALVRRQLSAEREQARLTERLLTLSARLHRRGEGPDRLLREVAAAVGGTVLVVEPGDAAWEALAAEHERPLTGVRHGRTQAAALSAEGDHVLLHAVGPDAPHPVLVARRPTPWPRHLQELFARVTGQVALLRYPIEHRDERAAVERSRRNIHVSILQYLMRGDWDTAARVAQPLRAAAGGVSAAGVLAAEEGVVAVLQCARDEDRLTAAQACERAAPGALVALCPAEYRHVILALPHTEGGPDPLSLLRGVVAEHPGRLAGVSTRRSWARTAAAYLAARQALAAAAGSPSRVLRDPGGTPVATLLPSTARVWAHHVLAGLDRLGADQRALAVPTARRVLSFGALRAGRLLGVDRTTANKRLASVMEALGLDRSRVAHRAVADLAFGLADLPVPSTVSDGPLPRLSGLLRSPSLVRWAQEELQVFEDPAAAPPGGWLGHGRDDGGTAATARRLLATWLECDCRIGVTAGALGMHRNTLPVRLAAAGARLRLPLMTTGTAKYSLLWQLVAAGQISGSDVPDPTAERGSSADLPAPGSAGIYRMYDYYLDGKDNYVSDREIGERVVAVLPTIKEMSRVSRRHVLKVPGLLAKTHGIRQFLDIGSGAPSSTERNIHHVVGEVAPDSRVVYVDNDELAVMRGQTTLASVTEAAMVRGDLREPEGILADPAVTRMLDFSRPVALCLHSVLHFLHEQEDAQALVATLVDALPSGSFVSMIHGSTDAGPHIEEACEVYRQAGIAMTFRTHAEVCELVDGLELLEPGVVPVQHWSPPGRAPEPTDLPEGEFVAYALLARKR